MAYRYSYDDEEKVYTPPKLKTDRSMWKLMLLNILTLGIYSIVFFMPFSYDLDKIAPTKDRSRTMSYLVAYLISCFTCSIVLIFWHHQIASRVEEALAKRQIPYSFGTGTVWAWYFFGSFILIGPFIYFHRLCKAMNLLCADYNERPVIE